VSLNGTADEIFEPNSTVFKNTSWFNAMEICQDNGGILTDIYTLRSHPSLYKNVSGNTYWVNLKRDTIQRQLTGGKYVV